MRKFLILIKYRLALTVALSATVGYFLYQAPPDFSLFNVFIGVFFLAAGSAALNQYQERSLDIKMSRTHKRPIPSGTISAQLALLVIGTCILTGGIFLFQTGLIPLLLGISNLFIYNLIYTKLKRISIFAILPGGMVGAIPPIIGWTAAGGSISHPNILFLATLIFLWQIPHFWLLIMRYGKEYENAGFKSISKHLDKRQISRLVFFWILISSVFIGSYPLFQIELQAGLAITLIIINIGAIILFYQILFRQQSPNHTRLAFIIINIFLTLILSVFILNAIL